MLIHSEKWKALKSQAVVRIWTSLPLPHPCDPNSYISFPSKPLPTLRAIPRRFSELDSKSRHPSPRPNFSGKPFSLWRIPDIALRLGWERRGAWEACKLISPTENLPIGVGSPGEIGTLFFSWRSAVKWRAWPRNFLWCLKAHLPLLYPAPTVLHD